MLRYKNITFARAAVFAVSVSLLVGTGLFTPKLSFAGHNPADKQEHPNTVVEEPSYTCPPEEPCPVHSPVYSRTGSYTYSHQDVFIPGRGPSLQVVRQYDSQDSYDGPFGYGWKFNFDITLIETTDESGEIAVIRRGDGVRLIFTKNPDGTYSPPLGRHDVLIKKPAGTFTWYQSSCSTGCGVGTRYHFDSSGVLSDIEDANHNTMTFSYDQSGKLTQIADAPGRKLNITYGTNNKISFIKDPANRVFSYSYSPGGDLTTYTDPLGNMTTYNYDTKHKLTSIIDALGNTVTEIAYDEKDRVKTYTEQGGTWTVTYDPENNTTYKDDPNGKRWTYTYNETGQLLTKKDPLNNSITNTWDDDINLTSITDANGNTTSYTYDTNGKRLSKTDALGNITTYTYDPAQSMNTMPTKTLLKLSEITEVHYILKQSLIMIMPAIAQE
jgi:YD repeat-containing protein